MAVSLVYSTLMVILSHSKQDFEAFWTHTGSVNDVSDTKHQQDIGNVVRDGNFRSSLIDSWDSQSFLSVSVCGTNIYGDVLWETEFNTTTSSVDLSSWLTGDNIITSSAVTSLQQETTFGDQFYRVRIGPTGVPEKSWFAMSYGELTFKQIPVIFIPRQRDVPFIFPVIKDGPQGCWQTTQLINATEMFTDSTMTPAMCIESCWDDFDTAVVVTTDTCYCGTLDPDNPPLDESTQCYLSCDDGQQCGGFAPTAGTAYHVQGSLVPGEIAEERIFSDTYANVDSVQIDTADVLPSTASAFISSLKITTSPEVTFIVQYSIDDCSTASEMKTVSSDAPIVFTANGSAYDVDILQVGCIELVLNSTAVSASVEVFGPDPTSEHIPVSAVVVRATSESPETTSTSSSSSSTSTSTSTTTTTSTPSSTTTTSTKTTSTTPTSTTTTTTTPTSTTTATTTPTSTTTSSTTTTSPTTPSSTISASSSQASSTQTTASTPSTTTTATATTPSTCSCNCQDSLPQLNITVEELQEKIAALQKKLAVNVSELSSTIRKLTSADDERVSAKSIGYVGIGMLASMFGAILFIDSAMLIRDIGTFCHNISQFCKRKRC